jgi:hypothetical protein
MTGVAELHIIFDADIIPVAATCQICGAAMPDRNRLDDSKKAKIEGFAAQFDLHMREKHLDQYEARAVRKV